MNEVKKKKNDHEIDEYNLRSTKILYRKRVINHIYYTSNIDDLITMTLNILNEEKESNNNAK